MPFLIFILAVAFTFLLLALAAWNMAVAVPELILNPGNTWAWFQALVAAYIWALAAKGFTK